jgi:gliding motility-associated-like protein
LGKDSVTIKVSQPFKLKVNAADTVCQGESVRLSASGAEMYKWFPSSTLDRSEIASPVALSLVSTAYRVVGADSAGCFTDTAYVSLAVGSVPTINLGPDKVLSAGTLFPLASTVTNGPITNWDWRPYTDLSCTNCAEPVANIKRDITYAVKGTTTYGCVATDTIHIKVFCENTQVFIPNVFTPDNDGINDVLMVRGTGIATVKSFKIFNRWGEMVFEKANFAPNDRSSGWNGTVRGVAAPSEVYVYTCEVLCENESAFVYKGNVAIIK